MKLSQIKQNPKNPRVIKDEKFEKLKQSIENFPEMMSKRPMVCVTDTDGKLYPLGGNMRLKALKELGYADIPEAWVTLADDWTVEQRLEFTIKDNVGFGDWNFEELANEWDSEQLGEWGLEVPSFAADIDYSILNDSDVKDQLEDMANGVKKAIQIEFEVEDYEVAKELVKFWREQKLYIGGFMIEKLKTEKDKL
jgi:hypothetical protein